MKIADAAMTAEWELALKAIETDTIGFTTFQSDIKEYGRSTIAELLKISPTGEQYPELECPKCKGHKLVFTNRIVKCPDNDCAWIQFRTVCKVQIPLKEIERLITKGQTSLIKGMESASGKKFDARLTIKEDKSVTFLFTNNRT